MEDTNVIMQLINSVGFPIATCVCLFWYNVKCIKPLIETVNALKIMVEHIFKEEG